VANPKPKSIVLNAWWSAAASETVRLICGVNHYMQLSNFENQLIGGSAITHALIVYGYLLLTGIVDLVISSLNGVTAIFQPIV